MAKGNNNVRSKKPHSSKPYDVSHSFVKKVTSGVSSLLPQTSWLSRWFASGTATEEDSQPSSNDGDNHDDEHTMQSPPCKRARIPLNRPFPANSFRVSSPIDRGETHPWPSESVASPIPSVFVDSAVPGPSGLGRTPVASSTFQTSSPNSEGVEGKLNGDGGSDSSESTSGCSSLAPQRITSGSSPVTLTTPVTQKLSNNKSQISLFPSTMHKLSPAVNTPINRRRPSFNVSSFGSPNLDTSKLSRESSLNSPFYIGRTMYGGASAYRRPREGISSESVMSSTRRGGVTVRPSNEKSHLATSAEVGMSQTARRILEALEQFSSPVSEARRMPLPSVPPLSAKRKRTLDLTSPVKSSNAPAAAINPLTIPMPPERLRLHRLQDATAAARRLANSMSISSSKYTIRTGEEAIQHFGTGKVTKSKPLDEDERPLPVNLPNISLPITTLPTFDLFSPLVQSTTSSSNPRTNQSDSTSKATAKSDQNHDSAEAENNKIYCAISTSSKTLSSSCYETTTAKTATTNIGMKSINFMHAKDAVEMPNFKFGSDNTDAFQTNCIRKYESSSKSSIKFSCTSKSSPKTVSFTDVVSYNFNNPTDSSIIQNANILHTSSMSNAHPKSPFAIKGAPFENISSSSVSNLKANEFVFSTPTVLPTSKSKATSESKVNNFYFSKPEALEVTKSNDKVNMDEPNGFHKHSLRSDDSKDTSVHNLTSNNTTEKKTGNKEVESYSGTPKSDVSEKLNPSEKSKPMENNGWNTKFIVPESWECPSCMVRNKNDVQACVCCESKRPSSSSSTLKKTDLSEKPVANSSVSSYGWGNKFQLQPGMWECSECLVRNKETDVKCVACATPQSSAKESKQPESSQSGKWGSQFRMAPDMWECSTCFVRNKQQDTKCVSCSTIRSGVNSGVSGADTKKPADLGQQFKKNSGIWECPVCMIHNKDSLLKCAACEEPKPGLDKNRLGASSSIKFNFEMPTAAASFKFGIDKAGTKPSELRDVPSFKFDRSGSETAPTTQCGFSFGSSTETKVPSGFTFGIPQSTPASCAASTSTKSDPTVALPTSTLSSTPAIPTFTTNTSIQSEIPKAGGFSFGVTSSASTVETKKVNVGSSGTENRELEKNASPSSNFEKIANSATTVSKSAQSNPPELKSSNFNFVPSTVSSKPAAFNFSTNLAASTVPNPVVTSAATFVAPSNISDKTSTSVASTSSIFSFGKNNSSTFSNPSVSSAPTFSFKGSVTQTAASNVFGTSPNQLKSPSEGLFSNKTTPAPVFGSFSPKTTSLQSFGTTTTTTSVPSFSSGIATAATAFAPGNTTAGTSFGSSSTKPIFASASGNFGTVTTTVSAPVSTSVITSAAGSVSTNFTATTTSFAVPVTTIGGNVTSPGTFGTTTTPSNLGIPSSTTSASSNVAQSFVACAPVAFGAPSTTSNNFGAASGTPGFNTSSSNIFGSNNTPSFGTSTTSGFGSTPATPSFGNNFGSVTTAASAFGTSAPAVSTVASTPSLQVFGGFSNASKPGQGVFLFGSTPTTTAMGPSFSFNASQAGSTQQPVSSTPVFGFGSANPTSVTTSTTTTPTAVAGVPAQGFGAFSFPSGSGTTASGTPALFGNAAVFGSPANAAPLPPTFGAGNTASSNMLRPSTFNFGSGGSQQPFPFGSGSQSGTTQPSGGAAAAAAAFSFGQGQQPPAQPQPLQFNPNVRPTFNFTGGETPQFTASAPSPTATPQRRVKKAVRRTQRP